MLRIQHALMQHRLRVGEAAASERPVRPKVAVDHGHFRERAAHALPVRDQLTARSRRLAGLGARRAGAFNDLQQLVLTNPGQNMRVEDFAQVSESGSLKRCTCQWSI